MSEASTAARAADPKLGFRADINGLRAIAVLAVLDFHFEPADARRDLLNFDQGPPIWYGAFERYKRRPCPAVSSH